MTVAQIEPEMLKANYLALRLCIIDENITVERSVEVLVRKFPAGDRRKPGVIPKFSKSELMDMKQSLETGKTFQQVAQKYGLRRGDNVYQMLKRAKMLPERKKQAQGRRSNE